MQNHMTAIDQSNALEKYDIKMISDMSYVN